jgi:hypothetical protein
VLSWLKLWLRLIARVREGTHPCLLVVDSTVSQRAAYLAEWVDRGRCCPCCHQWRRPLAVQRMLLWCWLRLVLALCLWGLLLRTWVLRKFVLLLNTCMLRK